MYAAPITPADTARAKHARPMARYTRAECAAIIENGNTNRFYEAQKDRLTDGLFAIVGERPVHGAAVGECDNCWGLIIDGRCGSCGERVS